MMNWLLVVFHLLFAPSHASVVDRASGSVVRIHGESIVTKRSGQTQVYDYVCTGFVVAVNRVVTAAHCAGNLTADGKPALIIAKDENYDLLLLATPTNKPVMALRDAPVVRREPLTGIGYAYGLSTLVVLEGNVLLVASPSPFNEDKTPPGITVDHGWIQGQSGGPVIDREGRVVGVIQQTDRSTGYGVGVVLMRAFLLGTS